MQKVVSARRTTSAGWDAEGIARALEAIRSGALIDVEGASGPLEFDADSFTDPVDGLYRHWRIEDGEFRTVDLLEDAAPAGQSEAEMHPVRAADLPVQTATDVPVRTGLWAVLVGASVGWENYRHQADVLAQYQVLRRNGVPDDHIILVMDSTIGTNPRNSEPGVVRNASGGPNLLDGVDIDYDISGMTVDQLMAILRGHVSAATPTVLGASKTDNVLVFVAGHGETDGVFMGAERPILGVHDPGRVLGPADLRSALASASYRRLLIAIEACKSGVFGAGFNLPRALMLTSASPTENSMSGTYDLDLRVWLSDQFAEGLWRAAEDAPDSSIADLYRRLYVGVTGSHVGVFGTSFGNARAISLGEFLTP
jgi:glycosylphosphatidylinositol transamidase (GPIT) subunit GPI8